MINITRRLRAPHIFIIAGIAVVAAVTFAVIIATLNRGFDWSDEGFVYVMVASNRVSSSEFFGFQYLLNPVYEMLGSSVLAFRILRLCCYIALGVVITLLARKLLLSRGIRLGRVGWLLVGLVAQIGTFAAWSYPPRYLGYNELSSWLTQLAVALLIFLLLEGHASGDSRTSWRWWMWLITGAVLSALLVAKITAGVFLLLLAIPAALLVVGGIRWKRLAALAGGFVGGFLLMLVTGMPLFSYFATSARLVADPSTQADSGYSVTTLLATYLVSMAVTVTALAIPILLAGVIVFVVRGFRAGVGPGRRYVVSAEYLTLLLAFVLAIVVVSIVVFPGVLDTWESLGVSNTFLLALAIMSFAVLATPAASASNSSRRRTATALTFAFGLFAIAPLISALGTNNRIFGHTVFSTTLWAVGAAIGLTLLWQRSEALSAVVRLLPVLLLGVIVATSGLAVAGDVFLHPYRTAPYFTQKSTVGVGDLRGIRMTEGETELYTWLHDAALRENAQGVPTLSIASPGALFAFNASGWSAVWPGASWASSIAQSCTESLPGDLIVLQSTSQAQGSDGYDRLVTGLKECGIDFPSNFKVVEHHKSDNSDQDVRVWRLR